ncbi:hypothetical protein SK128_004573 [Halocaridina rubra]|uniref:FHA domain-containing protein n=1 Tax=Halocaridina rubra TaxID=373956 RepID=A0AAN8WV29_HALRR
MTLFFERLGFSDIYALDIATKEKIIIGRSLNCDLSFPSPHVSRQHCEISCDRTCGKLFIKNLKETNVTHVEDTRLSNTSRTELHVGYKIGLGVPLNEDKENKEFVFLRLCQTTDPAECENNNGRKPSDSSMQEAQKEKKELEIAEIVDNKFPSNSDLSHQDTTLEDRKADDSGMVYHNSIKEQRCRKDVNTTSELSPYEIQRENCKGKRKSDVISEHQLLEEESRGKKLRLCIPDDGDAQFNCEVEVPVREQNSNVGAICTENKWVSSSQHIANKNCVFQKENNSSESKNCNDMVPKFKEFSVTGKHLSPGIVHDAGGRKDDIFHDEDKSLGNVLPSLQKGKATVSESNGNFSERKSDKKHNEMQVIFHDINFFSDDEELPDLTACSNFLAERVRPNTFESDKDLGNCSTRNTKSETAVRLLKRRKRNEDCFENKEFSSLVSKQVEEKCTVKSTEDLNDRHDFCKEISERHGQVDHFKKHSENKHRISSHLKTAVPDRRKSQCGDDFMDDIFGKPRSKIQVKERSDKDWIKEETGNVLIKREFDKVQIKEEPGIIAIKEENIDNTEKESLSNRNVSVCDPTVCIKQEPLDSGYCQNNATKKDDANDDDDCISMYSQVDETIWLSSDEDEENESKFMKSVKEEPFVPQPSSPDLDIAHLFEDNDLDNRGFQGKSPEPDEDDQWLQVLSQNLWEDEDFMKSENDSKKPKSKSTKKCVVPSCSESSKSSLEDSPSNVSTWWPSLSQNFFDDDDDDIFDTLDSSCTSEKVDNKVAEKNLSSVIERLKTRDVRKSQLISPKIPLPHTKNDQLRKRSKSLSLPEKDASVQSSSRLLPRKITMSSDGDNTQKSEIPPKLNSKKQSKTRKGSKKNPNLRDDLSSRFNLDSYKAIAKQLPSKCKDGSSASGSVSHAEPHQASKSHLVLDKVRPNENISVQKRTLDKTSKDPVRSTVAVKITHKNRSAKLTEINLFPSPLPCLAKTKRTAFKIPKKSAFLTSQNVSQAEATLNVDITQANVPSLHPADEQDKNLDEELGKSTLRKSNQHCPITTESVTSTVNSSSLSHSLPSTSSDRYPADGSGINIESNNIMKNNIQHNLKDSETISDTLIKGILRLFVSGKKSSGKRVHFPLTKEELNKVVYISPRKNKEKLGMLDARAREIKPMELLLEQHQIPANYADIFIYQVCHWNYDWLGTYKAAQESQEVSGRAAMPPPVFLRKNYPTLILYQSYKDYKEIFRNLLYLEVWESVFRDWVKYHHLNVWLPALVDVVQNAFIEVRKNSPLKSWRVKLIMLVTHEQSVKCLHPRQGALIALRLVDGRKRVNIFGYVENFSKQKKRMVSKELEESCPQGELCIMMDVRVCKDVMEVLTMKRMISVINVCYLKPHTRTWEGLCKLPLSPLCRDILGPTVEAFTCNYTGRYLVDNMSLNESQTKAVVHVGNKCVFDQKIPKISLIHGPPGTGKTRTLTALIAQIITLSRIMKLPQCRILVCAPSNAAVDELTLRLLKLREINIPLRVVRVGMRDSVCPEVRGVMLDAFVKKQIEKEISIPKNVSTKQEWERKKNMVEKAAADLENSRKEKRSHAEIKAMEQRLNELVRAKQDLERSFGTRLSPNELNSLQQKWQQEILLGAEVITTTLGGCLSRIMADTFLHKQQQQHHQSFTCCIVDEAGQCKETETWMPLLLGIRKLVLVGDHRQLPATVLSQIALDKNLKQSLFERFYHRFVVELQMDSIVHLLDIQYRMHPEIASFPSEHFYYKKLATCTDIVESRTYNFHPYIVFDVKNSKEEKGPMNDICNEVEASVVRKIIEALESYVSNKKIGIITPYQRQKQLLEGKLSKFYRNLKLTVNTIDGFQGQERDIIILSFVRANNSANIGFLSQRQRLNVALTRARQSCYIVANLSSLSSNEDLHSLIENANSRRLVRIVTNENQASKDFFLRALRK